MSRTYRKLTHGRNPNWTTDYIPVSNYTYKVKKVIRRSTKKERALYQADGKNWYSKIGNRYYYNLISRKYRMNDRIQFSKIPRIPKLAICEEMMYDDSKPLEFKKGIKWVIY